MTEFNNQNFQESVPKPTKPDNYLALSIIATVVSLITCCGWVSCIGVILGIIAIVFSTQVDSKYFAGDFVGAESASKNAKLLSMIAIGTIILSIVWIIVSIVLAGGFTAIMEQYQNTLDQYR
ncbi:MAG: CD225/dispanin family protein [Prevotella sp.]|jgi:hypothetical protein|nr:CD225/dispanin family protein [Prevotella sp.]